MVRVDVSTKLVWKRVEESCDLPYKNPYYFLTTEPNRMDFPEMQIIKLYFYNSNTYSD